MWNKMEEVRRQMEIKGIKKIAGMSWIEIDGKSFKFFAHDNSYPEIYPELKKLHNEIELIGYIPDTNWVLNDLGEEQKEGLLCSHR